MAISKVMSLQHRYDIRMSTGRMLYRKSLGKSKVVTESCRKTPKTEIEKVKTHFYEIKAIMMRTTLSNYSLEFSLK